VILKFSRLAWEDYERWLARDKKIAEKINSLLRELSPGGRRYSGTVNPGPLRRALFGYSSRKITATDRLIYKLEGDAIIIISCMWRHG